LILTPIDRLKAWVSAYVLLISREKIYDPASIVKGTSSPKLFAMAMAMAVLPVPGCPPIKTALPAILPSLMSSRMIPAALLASA
jgi:Ni,Fe-hydrogenase I small subunit